MALAFRTREHFLDVVEAAHQASSEVERLHREPSTTWRARAFTGVEASSQDVVDRFLEAPVASLGFLDEACGHVRVERQGRPHDALMLHL